MENQKEERMEKEEKIRINIKTLDNKTVPIVTSTNVSVSDFKKRIESEMKVPIESQRLIYQGKVLKDNLFLKDYSMKDSSTLHMISRPQNHPNLNQNSNSQPSNSNAPNSTNNLPNQPQEFNNVGQPNMGNLLLGSITLPDNAAVPPQFSHLLGEVFNSLGIRGAPQFAPQPPVQPSNEDGFMKLRQLLTNLSQSISNLPSSISPSSSIASSSLLNDPTSSQNISSGTTVSPVENAGICLGQLANSFEQIHPALSNLSGLLKNETTLLPNNNNNNGENNSFSREQVEGLAIQLSTVLDQLSSVSSLLSGCLSSIRMGEVPGRGQAILPSSSMRTQFDANIPAGAVQVSMPLFTVNPRAGVTMPPPQSNVVPPNNATTNILNHIGSIINGAPASQMPPTAVPNGDSASSIDPNRSNTAAVLMSQTFNAVNQAINNPYPSSVSSVIGSIAQGLSDMDQESEDETVLDHIVKRILDYMTLPEMLSVMSGNWTPVQRLHPILKEFILNEILKRDSSPANLERLAEEISGSLKGTLHPDSLPEDVRRRIRPGFDISQLVHQVVKKHVMKLIQLILSNLPVTQAEPYPFANAFKDWTVKFVEELVTVMSQCFQGGVTDASLAIKYFLQGKLNFMSPEFSQMGTNMVTSYIMQTYSSAQNNNNTRNDNNNNDPSSWENTIKVDEMRQAASNPQRPFSDSYNTGTSKKRKAAAPLVNKSNSVTDRVKEAIKSSGVSPRTTNNNRGTKEEIPEGVNNLGSNYNRVITEDVRRRLETDPDFDPKRTPNSAKLFDPKNNQK